VLFESDFLEVPRKSVSEEYCSTKVPLKSYLGEVLWKSDFGISTLKGDFLESDPTEWKS